MAEAGYCLFNVVTDDERSSYEEVKLQAVRVHFVLC